MAYSIKRIQSGSTKNIWEWDSNEILLDQASQDKTFYELRISYEGTLPTIYTKVDEVAQTTPTLTVIETGVGATLMWSTVDTNWYCVGVNGAVWTA